MHWGRTDETDISLVAWNGVRAWVHAGSSRARYTFSAVIGKLLMRTPTASATALAIAGATGARGFSPIPRAL